MGAARGDTMPPSILVFKPDEAGKRHELRTKIQAAVQHSGQLFYETYDRPKAALDPAFWFIVLL